MEDTPTIDIGFWYDDLYTDAPASQFGTSFISSASFSFSFVEKKLALRGRRETSARGWARALSGEGGGTRVGSRRRGSSVGQVSERLLHVGLGLQEWQDGHADIQLLPLPLPAARPTAQVSDGSLPATAAEGAASGRRLVPPQPVRRDDLVHAEREHTHGADCERERRSSSLWQAPRHVDSLVAALRRAVLTQRGGQRGGERRRPDNLGMEPGADHPRDRSTAPAPARTLSSPLRTA